jgi:hypothetical protein
MIIRQQRLDRFLVKHRSRFLVNRARPPSQADL